MRFGGEVWRAGAVLDEVNYFDWDVKCRGLGVLCWVRVFLRSFRVFEIKFGVW